MMVLSLFQPTLIFNKCALNVQRLVPLNLAEERLEVGAAGRGALMTLRRPSWCTQIVLLVRICRNFLLSAT